MLKKTLVALTLLVVLLALALFLLRSKLSHPLPESVPGPEADALASAMQAAVNTDAWQRTEVVRWVFRGAQAHVWDRSRGFALVSWKIDGPDDLVEAWLRLEDRRGVVHRRGIQLSPGDAEPFLEQAWSHWCNDSFWLNPIAKLFDPGTERGLVELESGNKALLVTYSQGGNTPGDSYLWILDEGNRPKAWRMWTSILPIPGLETSWESWIELESGAFVATHHRTPLGLLELSAVSGEIEPSSEDRFAVLVEALALTD